MHNNCWDHLQDVHIICSDHTWRRHILFYFSRPEVVGVKVASVTCRSVMCAVCHHPLYVELIRCPRWRHLGPCTGFVVDRLLSEVSDAWRREIRFFPKSINGVGVKRERKSGSPQTETWWPRFWTQRTFETTHVTTCRRQSLPEKRTHMSALNEERMSDWINEIFVPYTKARSIACIGLKSDWWRVTTFGYVRPSLCLDLS